ncbi:hypothetical protein tb265_29780 [Gemmatimonadetes bacterium T265]|nr:hypothetical protein tb265_29780 [Gemmatimonadetes bacterium T265]
MRHVGGDAFGVTASLRVRRLVGRGTVRGTVADTAGIPDAAPGAAPLDV